MVIYKAEFPNGKVYIGKTKNFKSRKYHHIWASEKTINTHILMPKAIKKYGKENINWNILYECSDQKEMDEMEIFYIKKYNSTIFQFGYNMVCGDKEGYTKRENFNEEYQLEIIKKKLKSNGHDPEKYIVINEGLSKNILSDYGKMGIRGLSKKYKISRQRLRRFILSNNIKIDKDICSIINSINLSEYSKNIIIEKFKSGNTIKKISEEESQTIQTISRVLHDSGVRKSKRFKNGKRYDGRQPKKKKLDTENR